ncbi:MAG: sulfite exporter TauE/SafE family protein [Flavobacteriaceae bacterium]
MMWSAFVLGLMGSLHCMGMCGPIALMLPIHREAPLSKWTKVSLYHMGRILTYALIGLIFGLIGKGLHLFGSQQTLSITIGIIMIIMALLPQKIAPQLKILAPYLRWVGHIKSRLGTLLQRRGNDTFLTLGFLNGFLPCGLVYMGLAGALAMGSALEGAFFMALFGVGTVPMMTAIIHMGSQIRPHTLQRIKKLIPVVVILIGVLFIVRGLGLGIPYLSPKMMAEPAASAILECH